MRRETCGSVLAFFSNARVLGECRVSFRAVNFDGHPLVMPTGDFDPLQLIPITEDSRRPPSPPPQIQPIPIKEERPWDPIWMMPSVNNSLPEFLDFISFGFGPS